MGEKQWKKEGAIKGKRKGSRMYSGSIYDQPTANYSVYAAPTSTSESIGPQLPNVGAGPTADEIAAQKAAYKHTGKGGKEKRKMAIRVAGGKVWEDTSLLEWPEDDYRIFVGDLGNDVTDSVLAQAFEHYPSFAKAKVVRDRITTKSKGYGFVSLLCREIS